MRAINRIVIHCSATKETQKYEPEQMLRDHKARGFATYGYHYYIRRTGAIVPLRPEAEPGAHAKGYNAHSIGICYEGGLSAFGKAKDTRTDPQKEALRELVEALKRKYSGCSVVGHRDLSPDLDGDGIIEPQEWVKMCPCFNVKSEFR